VLIEHMRRNSIDIAPSVDGTIDSLFCLRLLIALRCVSVKYCAVGSQAADSNTNLRITRERVGAENLHFFATGD